MEVNTGFTFTFSFFWRMLNFKETPFKELCRSDVNSAKCCWRSQEISKDCTTQLSRASVRKAAMNSSNTWLL